jgi:hypothetical protein
MTSYHQDTSTPRDFSSLVRLVLNHLPAPEHATLQKAKINVKNVDLHKIMVPRRPDLLSPSYGAPFFHILKVTIGPQTHLLGELAPPYVRDIPIPLRPNQIGITIHLNRGTLLDTSGSLVTLTYEVLGDEAVIIERRVDFLRQSLKLAA